MATNLGAAAPPVVPAAAGPPPPFVRWRTSDFGGGSGPFGRGGNRGGGGNGEYDS